jgi:hypothetical protein
MKQRGVYFGVMLLVIVIAAIWVLMGCASLCGGDRCDSYNAGWN